ncbi:MAG: hypothetical protein SO401_03755 [Blautia sp.]|nr:hypothetical protein [Blautia sp.]
MSGYILCQTKKAEHPYFIENISMNIYSIEELCYYLYHNLYLVDQTTINEELCTWLENELKLPALAAKLRKNLGKYNDAEDILYPIFKEINYLTYEELRILNGQIARLNQESIPVRQKRKGDSFVENGMYVNAIQVYRKILERDDLDGEREGLREQVWYNLGCAHSCLFQMEEASECFFHAYETGHSPKALKAYLLAYRSIAGRKEYEKKLTELKVAEELKKELNEALDNFSRIPPVSVEKEEIDGMLVKITREYHRSTGS